MNRVKRFVTIGYVLMHILMYFKYIKMKQYLLRERTQYRQYFSHITTYHYH